MKMNNKIIRIMIVLISNRRYRCHTNNLIR